jgi:hypothetical protein
MNAKLIEDKISYPMIRIIDIIDNYKFYLYKNNNCKIYSVVDDDVIDCKFISFSWFYDEC